MMEDTKVCLTCQGLGVLKETDAMRIVRDVMCALCKGEGLVYVGKGPNPFEVRDAKEEAARLKRLGDACMRTGKYEEALVKYCEALAKDDVLAVRANRVLARLKLKQNEAAADEATRILGRAKGGMHAKLLLRRAIARSRFGAKDLALADFEAVLDMQPGHPRAEAEKLLIVNEPPPEVVTPPPVPTTTTNLEACD